MADQHTSIDDMDDNNDNNNDNNNGDDLLSLARRQSFGIQTRNASMDTLEAAADLVLPPSDLNNNDNIDMDDLRSFDPMCSTSSRPFPQPQNMVPVASCSTSTFSNPSKKLKSDHDPLKPRSSTSTSTSSLLTSPEPSTDPSSNGNDLLTQWEKSYLMAAPIVQEAMANGAPDDKLKAALSSFDPYSNKVILTLLQMKQLLSPATVSAGEIQTPSSSSSSPLITVASLTAPPATSAPSPLSRPTVIKNTDAMSDRPDPFRSHLSYSLKIDMIRILNGIYATDVRNFILQRTGLTTKPTKDNQISQFITFLNESDVDKALETVMLASIKSHRILSIAKVTKIIKSGYVLKTGKIDATVFDRWLVYNTEKTREDPLLAKANLINHSRARADIHVWNQNFGFISKDDILAIELYDCADIPDSVGSAFSKKTKPAKVLRLHVTPQKYNDALASRSNYLHLKGPNNEAFTAEIFEVIDYEPCYVCLSLFHDGNGCSGPTRCSKCGQDHSTEKCSTLSSFRCYNCTHLNAIVSKNLKLHEEKEAEYSIAPTAKLRQEIDTLAETIRDTRNSAWNPYYNTNHLAKSSTCPQIRKVKDSIRQRRKDSRAKGKFYVCPPKYRSEGSPRSAPGPCAVAVTFSPE